MPHRRRANEVSFCYLQSGGTCTGRSKLENLHRQEDSLEPAPAGGTINQTQFEFQTQFCFCFWNERENLTGILIMPLETFGRFFHRTFSLIRFLDPRLMEIIESKFDFSFEIK